MCFQESYHYGPKGNVIASCLVRQHKLNLTVRVGRYPLTLRRPVSSSRNIHKIGFLHRLCCFTTENCSYVDALLDCFIFLAKRIKMILNNTIQASDQTGPLESDTY